MPSTNILLERERRRGKSSVERHQAALHSKLIVPASGSVQMKLRLTNVTLRRRFAEFDQTFAQCRAEADEFTRVYRKKFQTRMPAMFSVKPSPDDLSKQFYYYDIPEWIQGDPAQPAPPPERLYGRNSDWKNLNNADILSMPDKVEYPWYCRVGSGFPLHPARDDRSALRKSQLVLLTREWYMHPRRQLPPTSGFWRPLIRRHAWQLARFPDRSQTEARFGSSRPMEISRFSRAFFTSFAQLYLVVNRKDSKDRTSFKVILGLDNIGVFDRSAPFRRAALSIRPMARAGWRCIR